MKRFSKSESGVTKTALVVNGAGQKFMYSPSVLQTPVRKKVNAELSILNAALKTRL